MTSTEDVVKIALKSAREKLTSLESEQEALDQKISQTESEIAHLKVAIRSLKDLNGQIYPEPEH